MIHSLARFAACGLTVTPSTPSLTAAATKSDDIARDEYRLAEASTPDCSESFRLSEWFFQHFRQQWYLQRAALPQVDIVRIDVVHQTMQAGDIDRKRHCAWIFIEVKIFSGVLSCSQTPKLCFHKPVLPKATKGRAIPPVSDSSRQPIDRHL